MAEEKSSLQDKEIELLKLNHQSLHDGVWSCHRLAWMVTSIFIPVLFAMLGYLIKESDITEFQAVMGFLVTEGLLFIWWLIMRIFEHYNELRFQKLKKIESRFNEIVPGLDFKVYELTYGDAPREFKFSPVMIYKILFSLYTVLNLGFLLTRLIA